MKVKIPFLSLLVILTALVGVLGWWWLSHRQERVQLKEPSPKTVEFSGEKYDVLDYKITQLNANGNVNARMFIGERKISP